MNLASIIQAITYLKLDAFITNTNDEHFNEIEGPECRRLHYLTGFTGNYAYAIVNNKSQQVSLYTSEQYLEQAYAESPASRIMKIDDEKDLVNDIANMNLRRVGICSKYIPSSTFFSMKQGLKPYKIELVDIDYDLIEKEWKGRPTRKFKPIFDLEKHKLENYVDLNYIQKFDNFVIDKEKGYDLSYNVTGSSYKDKIKIIRKMLKSKQGILVSYLDQIAWILNLRGEDIMYTPVFYAYMYITQDRLHLFISGKMKASRPEVTVHSYESFFDFMKNETDDRVLVSSDTNYYTYKLIKSKPYFTEDISKVMQFKNTVELFGMKYAGIKDAEALVRLIVWINDNISGGISELDIEDKLEKLKKPTLGYFTSSFRPIIATGKNSNRIFHRPTGRKISIKDPILIDSGSQYYYGTTDSTRTVHFGEPTEQFKHDYTLILKSIIHSKSVRKRELRGDEVDSKTRELLIKENKNYRTSTGHGIGHFSIVHERMPRINYDSDILGERVTYTLEPSIFAGDYGIRIEDIVYIKQHESDIFQSNLTFVPIQLDLVNINELTYEEKKYLNLYNRFVRKYLAEIFKYSAKEYEYVMKNTEPIKVDKSEKGKKKTDNSVKDEVNPSLSKFKGA